METSTPAGEIPATSIAREALASAVRHTGPTAERYEGALERYLGAVAGDTAVAPGNDAGRLTFPHQVVGDVMTRGVVTAHEDAVFKQIVVALARNRVGAVPVIDSQRRVVGVVSEADLLARVSGDHWAAPRGHRLSARGDTRRKSHAAIARDLMTAPAVTTTPNTTIADAARLAARARVRRMPVVDADGALVGIVSRGDLLKVFLRDDAEIRRDIERDLIERQMPLDPATIDIVVHEGVVTLAGQLDRKLLVEQVVNAVRTISGVVDVDVDLTYRVDDSLLPPARPTPY